MRAQFELRSFRHFAFLLATVSVMSCKDKTTEPVDTEPTVNMLVIASGSSTVNVPLTGAAQTPGPLTLSVGTANPISVRWINSSGADITSITTAEYELRINTASGLIWTPTTGFSGTITPASVGSNEFTVVLFHKGPQHNELSKDVSVSVVP